MDVEVDTASLGPGVHQAALQVGAWRAANGVEVPVRVEVLATAPGPPMAGAMASLPLDDPRLPRVAVGPSAPAAMVSAVHDAHGPAPQAAHGVETHAASARKAAPSNPTRLSRSTQLRSKYLAAKQTPHAPAARSKDAHAKPSPVGEAVRKDAHAAPAKKDDHGAAKKDDHAKKDAHAAPKKDDHGAAKKDDHAKKDAHAAPKKDDHGAKKDDHGKPKEQAKHH